VYVLPVDSFDGSQHVSRALCRELLEIVDQVHLVEVATFLRDEGPRLVRGTGFAVEGRLKSNNPGKELRAHSYLFPKATLKRAFAEAGFPEKGIDLPRAAELQDSAYECRNALFTPEILVNIEQQLIRQANALVKRSAIPEQFSHAVHDRAKDRGSIRSLVRDLINRQSEEVMETIRVKCDPEGLEASRQLQFQSWFRPRTDQK
jgi:hypothetical protein